MVGLGYQGGGGPDLGVSLGLWVCSECIMYAAVAGGLMRECLERRFLGIAEAFSLLPKAKFGGIISGRLLMGPGMPHCGRRGYSVLRNSAMAMASIAAPIAVTMARDSPTGTTQPNQVMPGLRACMASGLTGRWMNTACRIG
jgi:hypothetical protein